MTMQAGLAPRTVVPGQVVEAPASAVIDPRSAGVHALMTVMHQLVRNSGAYHSEADVDNALRALEAFEKAHVTSAVRLALNEEAPLPAAKEDVTQRIPPSFAGNQPVPVGVQIDYNKLAAALVAARAAQNVPEDTGV